MEYKIDHKERFFKNVDKTKNCWLYKRGYTIDGYGRFSIRGKPWHAHRYSWKLANGDIPKGMYVLHKCDNPPCVNPDHLFIGTAKENFHDAIQKGRLDVIGESNAGARLTEKEIKEIRKKYTYGHRETGFHVLSKIYGVGKTTIWRIIKRKTWKHVV